MTGVATFSTPYVTKPYLTPDEYRNVPTGIDVASLVPDGSDAQQSRALEQTIRRASGIIDSYCDQILAATLDVELRRAFVRRDGSVYIHPDNWPILEVRDVQYGNAAHLMQPFADLAAIGATIEPYAFTIPFGAGRYSSTGPLDLSSAWPGAQLYVRYAYVNGWPTTLLSADAIAGSSTLSVVESLGIYGGPAAALSNASVPPATQLTCYDGGQSEDVSIASVTGNVLTLNAPLQFDHVRGVSLSAIPYQVKEACALITTALVQTRGDVSLVMGTLRSSGAQKKSDASVGDLGLARELLTSFRRVR